MGRPAALSATVVAALALAAARAPAHAEPSNERLVLTGLALAPPTYLVGVTLHEGSHALAALMVGADVDQLHLFPPGRDPRSKTFRFGWTYVSGLRTRRNKLFFYLAPKITDALFLGGYAALYFTDSLPANKYGQLALVVSATGFWVDFAKDALAFSPTNDVVKAFRLWCMTGWRQVPARIVYAGLDLAAAYAIARGYQKLFTHESSTTQMLALPVWSGSF